MTKKESVDAISPEMTGCNQKTLILGSFGQR
jgi:hypothetical protein